jgi:hypothetical protein
MLALHALGSLLLVAAAAPAASTPTSPTSLHAKIVTSVTGERMKSEAWMRADVARLETTAEGHRLVALQRDGKFYRWVAGSNVGEWSRDASLPFLQQLALVRTEGVVQRHDLRGGVEVDEMTWSEGGSVVHAILRSSDAAPLEWRDETGGIVSTETFKILSVDEALPSSLFELPPGVAFDEADD